MKILLVLPRPLFPPDLGAKIRSLNMFSRLAQRHSTTTLCLVPRGTEPPVLSQMADLFEKFVPIYWQEVRTFSARFCWEFLKSQASKDPYDFCLFRVPALQVALNEHLGAGGADVLLFDFLYTAANLPASVSCPTVLLTHNVESQIWLRRAALERHPIKKMLLRNEYRKMRIAEASLCKRFDLVLTVSAQDRVQLEQEFKVPMVRDVPTGVDTDYFSPQDGHSKPLNLVFVGAMDWYPNEDAVLHFVREIFPRVRQQHPAATLSIVGRNPGRQILRLAQEDASIEVTGWVRDVRPYLARAACCIVPLRIGGGTRIKIFEAMAMAKPVITTSVGGEGLPVVPDKEVIIADEPEHFAAGVVRVLRDSAWATRIGLFARRAVCQNFDWDAVVDQLERHLVEAAHFAHHEVSSIGAAR